MHIRAVVRFFIVCFIICERGLSLQASKPIYFLDLLMSKHVNVNTTYFCSNSHIFTWCVAQLPVYSHVAVLCYIHGLNRYYISMILCVDLFKLFNTLDYVNFIVEPNSCFCIIGI